MANGGNRFEWGAFALVVVDLVAASLLFFFLFAVAIFSDYMLMQFIDFLGVTEDGGLYLVRKGVKYAIVTIDGLIVLSFVTRGLFNTWKSTWG